MNRMDVGWHPRFALVALLLVETLVVSVHGQSAAPPATFRLVVGQVPSNVSEQRSRIDQVYDYAGRASGLPELNQALNMCSQLKQSGLPAEYARYVDQLTAWLLNRRGEQLVRQASQMQSQGNANQSQQLEQSALQDFTASLQLDPQWRTHHNRGLGLAMLGNSEEAIEEFARAVQADPQQVSSRFNLAELLLDAGRAVGAEQEYSAVLQMDPSDAAARLGRAHARFYEKRYTEALQDFDAVLRQEPQNAIAYADRADLRAFLGQWEAAAQDYMTAINLDQSLGRAYQSAAWLMATCPDARFRDREMALRTAQRAIALDGDRDYRYLDTLGAAQANADQFPAAQESLQRALTMAPPDAAPELRQRLAMYQQNRPYRESAR